MKAPKFVRRRRGTTEMVLQITSMADIFMILLVFLLKSYATGATNISTSAGLRLPMARTDAEQVEALKLEISENAVQLDDKPVVRLSAFRFAPQDMQGGIARPLGAALKLARQRQELISRSNSDVKLDRKVLVIADERTPYVTMKSVVLAAAIHGFSDVKLVAVKKD